MTSARAGVPTCPYCNNKSELVDGLAVYRLTRPDLKDKYFYRCAPCDAHVGCHPGTTNPLGSLANKELRQARLAAHAAFDPLWRSGSISRSEAYRWLAAEMGTAKGECHIGAFNLEQCRRVVAMAPSLARITHPARDERTPR